MSINQIAVYTDGTWGDLHDIGAKASNITLQSPVNGANILENALQILPSGSLSNNDDGKILTVQNGKFAASDIKASTITTLNDSVANIKSNAIKNITRNGTTFTATKLDGTTFTFTQQDNVRNPATVAPVEVGIGGSAAVGSSLKYAKEDHKHIISASPAFTSPTASTMPSLGSTTNALVNAKYVTNYFTSIWNKTHFVSGSTITSGTYDCFGWITSQGKNLYIEIVLPKSYMKMDGEYLNFKTSG